MSHNNIQEHINKYGWHCLYVFDPDGEKVEFTYSIGFEETFKHPEIMIFGLKKETAHGILDDIANDLNNGIKYELDKRLSNVIGGDFEVMFKEVNENAFSEYLGSAVDYYQKPFKAWVLFWPDKSNLLPFDNNCELTVQNEAIEIV